MNETLSRSLLAVEAAGLLLPLSLLYLLLFSITFGGSISDTLTVQPGVAVATLLAGAGLLALWRLLATGVIFGIAALRKVHRGWMLFCMLVAAWVVIAWLGNLWISLLTSDSRPGADLTGATLGIFGVPALVPLLHLAAERYWRGGDRT